MLALAHRHIVASLFLALILGVGIGYMWIKYVGISAGPISHERCALRTGMRKLWADHVIWTRCYIISAVAGLDDIGPTTERLLKNQDDIGEAVGKFYGVAAGKQLAQLLREHIMGAAEVVAAAKAHDTTAFAKSDEKWHKNAREISEFLSKANPHWPYQEMLDMMNQHLSLTTQETAARIGKEWNKDIAVFDEVFTQILAMADHLTNGIVAQFPDRV